MGFAALDDTGAQLLFRLVAAAYERRSLGVASHWPFDQWGRFPNAGPRADRLPLQARRMSHLGAADRLNTQGSGGAVGRLSDREAFTVGHHRSRRADVRAVVCRMTRLARAGTMAR